MTGLLISKYVSIYWNVYNTEPNKAPHKRWLQLHICKATLNVHYGTDGPVIQSVANISFSEGRSKGSSQSARFATLSDLAVAVGSKFSTAKTILLRVNVWRITLPTTTVYDFRGNVRISLPVFFLFDFGQRHHWLRIVKKTCFSEIYNNRVPFLLALFHHHVVTLQVVVQNATRVYVVQSFDGIFQNSKPSWFVQLLLLD